MPTLPTPLPPPPRFLPHLPLLSAACLSLLVTLCLPPLHASARALLRPRVSATARRRLAAVAALQQSRRLTSRPATFFFAAVSSTVSVPFYVAVLPAIIWCAREREAERSAQLPLSLSLTSSSLLTTLFFHPLSSSTLFFILFLFFRLVDFELGIRLVLALAVSLYVGNATKDLVCAPRPLAMLSEEDDEGEEEAEEARAGNGGKRRRPSRRRKASPPPPQQQEKNRIRLLTADASGASEAKSLLEYGFPSSHVMNSLVLSLHAIQCCRGRFPALLDPEDSRFIVSVAAARAVAVSWTLLVAMARVACGMHIPVDVAGGLLAGVLVVAALALEDLGGVNSSSSRLSLDARYVSWLAARGPPAAALHTLATTLLLRLHPLPLKYTTSFEATTAFAGACAGVALGASLGGSDHHHHLASSSSSSLTFLAAARRLAAGLAAVAS